VRAIDVLRVRGVRTRAPIMPMARDLRRSSAACDDARVQRCLLCARADALREARELSLRCAIRCVRCACRLSASISMRVIFVRVRDASALCVRVIAVSRACDARAALLMRA